VVGLPRLDRPARRLILIGAAALGALALAPASAPARECSIDDDGTDPGNVPALLDSGGYEWDVSEETKLAPANDDSEDFATLYDGGGSTSSTPPAPTTNNDSYDGFGALFVGPGGDASLSNQYFNADDNACSRENAGRELVFPPETVSGLRVQRKLFVATAGPPGARLLDTITNPSGKPVTTSVQVGDTWSVGNYGDLGSDSSTAVRSSSSGDAAFTPADSWIVTSDHAGGTINSDYALAHVFGGPGGRERIDFATLTGVGPSTGAAQDNLAWRWDKLRIRPGQTISLLWFEVQQAIAGRDAATEDGLAKASAQGYFKGAAGLLFAGMKKGEQAQVVNWRTPVKCAGRRVTIAGSDARDVIKGTPKADVIFSGDGNDVIKGLGGNDRICAGKGRDRLLGGKGRDILKGGAGRDVLRGGPGHDKLLQ
jgi:Ca2+-binding RTX toxin-like protein